MPKVLNDELLENHAWFFCPNGCRQHYTGETPLRRRVRKLEEELAEVKADRDRWKRWYAEEVESARHTRESLEHERRRIHGYRGALERARRDPTFLKPAEA